MGRCLDLYLSCSRVGLSPPQIGGPAPEPVDDGRVEGPANHPDAVGHLI